MNERKGSAEPVMFREGFMTGRGEWDYSVDRGGDRKKQHLNLYVNQHRFPKLPLGLLVVNCAHCRFLQLKLFMRRL
jgi:hypothetical protein